MTEPHEQADLELKVTDFGPIAKAEVDLRPLTVFVGPSNTGKSYLAILIYALHRYFNEVTQPRHRYYRPYRTRSANRQNAQARKAMDELAEVLGQRNRDAELSDLLSAEVLDFIRSRLEAFKRGDEIGNEIIRCFGINELTALIRKGCRQGAIVMRRHFSNHSKPAVNKLVLKSQQAEFTTQMPKGTAIRNDVENEFEVDHSSDSVHEHEDSFAWRLIEIVRDSDLRQATGPLHFPAFYLPADRTGIMHAHGSIVSAVIGNAPMTGLRPPTRTPMLSGVVADFLRQLIELDNQRDQRSKPGRDLDKEIEETILGGSVNVDRSELIGYPRFTYRPQGWKDTLPLMNASSMVSEIAPIVLYLRHVVGPDSVLIIEEPESHLHPAMQVAFTRQLAALVRSGVRLIVTTHSEWVLEELANTVQRSALSATCRKKIAGTDVALSPDDVGAWLFKQQSHPSGSIVEEVKLDEEIGLYPTGYDAVSEALYNENAKIHNHVQDRRAE